jgi:hypothetical protein
VLLGEGRHPYLSPAEGKSAADPEEDDRAHAGRPERTQASGTLMRPVRPPGSHRKRCGERQRAERAGSGGDQERNDGREQACGQRDEERPHDEEDLLERRLEGVCGRAQRRPLQQPGPERAQGRSDRRQQRSGESGAHADHHERRVHNRRPARGEQRERREQRAPEQDARRPAAIHQPARDWRAEPRRDEERGADEPRGPVAPAAVAHDEQKREGDHSHRHPRHERGCGQPARVRRGEERPVAARAWNGYDVLHRPILPWPPKPQAQALG